MRLSHSEDITWHKALAEIYFSIVLLWYLVGIKRKKKDKTRGGAFWKMEHRKIPLDNMSSTYTRNFLLVLNLFDRFSTLIVSCVYLLIYLCVIGPTFSAFCWWRVQVLGFNWFSIFHFLWVRLAFARLVFWSSSSPPQGPPMVPQMSFSTFSQGTQKAHQLLW
jgi:hypothetical protein